MTQSFLSPKIIVREEPPQIRSVPALATAVLGMVGIAEKGPIRQGVLVTSASEWRQVFGGYTTASRDSVAAVEGYFEEGGQFLWFSRTVHYTDITDPDTSTAVVATVDLDDDAGVPTAVLTINGKYAGAYANDLSVAVEDASDGDGDKFNLRITQDGVTRELFPNLSMDEASPRFVETVVNADGVGSTLIEAVALEGNRPASVGATPLIGGNDGLTDLADSDFTGDHAANTGLHALDEDAALPITLLAVPARVTAVVQNAMLVYCEDHRNGAVFAVLDSPAGQTAQEILTYVRATASLEGASEFGAMYYPHVRVLNPSTAVFGNAAHLDVPPSGHIAGVMARGDARMPGGIYRSPAGTEHGRLRSIVGFEILPGAQQPETFDETKRDLLYPARINSLTVDAGVRVIDGGRTLRGDGNFPNVAERRGVIFIQQSVKRGIAFAKHKNNDEALRAEVTRVIEAFLITQMDVGAFRSRVPREAFQVDFGRGLNPDSVVFAGLLRGRVGVATQKPAEFIDVAFSQDTRALQQELSQ